MRIACTRWLPAFLLLTLPGPAQAPAGPPAPAELVDHLVANAELYRVKLPSITASETIESEASYLILHRRVQAKGIFRVVRNPANGNLDESRQLTEVDGKPVAPGDHAALPWSMADGFGRFQQMFFTPAHRLCFTFAMLPHTGPGDTEQIAIAEQPEIATIPGCVVRGVTGLARVDPATQQLVYLERAVPIEIANKGRLAPFASVEIAPAKIGADTFWLPTVVIGTFLEGKRKGKFTAHYSNYHRYTGSITILPGVTEIEPPPPPVPPPH